MSPTIRRRRGRASRSAKRFQTTPPPTYLVRDRDNCYGPDFDRLLQSVGMEKILIAPRAPWQNPFVERLIGTLRRECLDHVIVWNERSLRRMLRLFFDYYQRERNHQGLENALIEAAPMTGAGRVHGQSRVGGLLNFYTRAA